MTWSEYIKARYRVPSLVESQGALETWFDTPFAARMLMAERDCCEHHLSGLAGYRLGHLSVSPAHDLIASFSLRHCFKLTTAPGGSPGAAQGEQAARKTAGIVNFETLPLPSEAIDVMVLHHTLDFSPKPREVLKEAARVVTAGGHLVIVGFNPMTVFGLAKWPAALLRESPVWAHHSLRLPRVVDWLTLLGFEVTHRSCGFREEGSEPDMMARVRQVSDLHNRAFYVVAATKRVVPLTPATHASWLPVRLPVLSGSRKVSSLPCSEEKQEEEL